MTYRDLVDRIKVEARIAGDANFDALVIGLINEVSVEAVQSQRPFELRKELDLPIDTQGIVELPEDFLFHHEVIFKDSDTLKEWELTDQDKDAPPAPRGMYGHPKTFEILSDAKITVKPFSSVVPGDLLFLVYYKKAPISSSEGLDEEVLLTRLSPFIIRATLRRIRMFHSDDIQVAQLLQGDISSAARGFTLDAPVIEKEVAK